MPDDIQTTPVTETEVTTPETTVDPVVETPPGDVGEGEGAGDPPAYAPNFKFKYSKFGENSPVEAEFDEKVKALVKDAETEKVIRDLYEKGFGIEHMYKPRHEKMKTELSTYQEAYNKQFMPLVQELRELSQAIATDDINTVCQKLNVPKEKLYKMVADDLKYQDMTPEQRSEVDRFRDSQRKAARGDSTVSQYQGQLARQSVQIRTLELDMALSNPDIAKMAQAVDSKRGAGTFRNQIIREGILHAAQTQQDLPVGEALKRVVQFFGPEAEAAPTQAAAAPATAAPAKKPVLPSFSGRSGSPTRKVPSSLEDLKQMAKEAQSNA